MALLITITDAGRAEIINADNTGTGPVVVAEIGFGTGQYAPSKTQTALTNEVKRVSSIAGQAVAADTIHVVAKDEGSDAYNVGELGLYSASGTLLAVYSQVAASGWIIQKAGASTLLLAVDIILESLNAASLTFGDVTFINPPATTDTPGVVQLEDSLTSSSTSKALTAKQGKKLQDEKQAAHANLLALAGLIGTADRLPYFTGAGALSLTTLSAFARTLLDDANATAALATLGAAPLASPGFTGTPTAPTAAAGTNTTQLATTAFVKAAIAALVDSSPGALDTLNELAAALGDDPNFATTMTNALAAKQPLDATLTALAAIATAADKLIYSTGSDQFATTTLTAKARTLLASVDEAAMRTFLQLVKQTSATDATAGSVLTVGAFGLGAAASVATKTAAELDSAATPTGLYRCDDLTSQGLPADVYTVLSQRLNATTAGSQIAIGYATGRMYQRAQNTAWSAWKEVWHSSNLVKQSSSTDATAGSVLLTGAGGLLGQPGTLSGSMNTLAGKSRSVRASLNSVTDGPLNSAFWLQGDYWDLDGSDSNATFFGSLVTSGDPRGFLRSKASGAWGSWAELWHTKNLAKQATSFDTTAGAMMAVGAFGLGSTLSSEPLLADFATVTPSGFYRGLGVGNATPTLNAPPGSANSQLGILCVRILSNSCYYYVFENGGSSAARRFWIGQNNSGTVTWQNVYHDGNLTPAELSPPGAVVHFARNSAPTGWLKANGAAVSRSTYAGLFAAIGTTFGAGDGSTTFNLPDLRGEFLRGWDDGRGVDSGRAFGSAQADELASHTHTLPSMTNDGTGNTYLEDANNTGTPRTANTGATGGSETRPRNIALLACIKY